MRPDAAALRRRPRVAASWGGRAVAEGLVLAAVVGWWLTAHSLPAGIFPSPLRVLQVLGQLLADPEFWANAGATALRVFLAVPIAAFAGTILALLPRFLPSTSGIVDDVLIPFLGAFPAIVWAILGTVWFGVTPRAVLIVQTLIAVPFCLVNVAEGVKNIPAEDVEMGRSFGRGSFAIFWRIELPHLRPFILAGAWIAYGVCWKISLIAELFGARSGLGFMLQTAQDQGDTDVVLSLCLVIVLFVIIGEWLIMRPLAGLFATGARTSGPADDGGVLTLYRAAWRHLSGLFARGMKGPSHE